MSVRIWNDLGAKMDGKDNGRLKELMKTPLANMTVTAQDEFVEELLNTSLFLPVDIDSDFSSLEDDDTIRFSPIVAKQVDGKGILPLFTDEEESEKFDYPNFVRVGCDEVAAILVQSEGVDDVVLNLGSENAVGLTVESFLDLVSATKIQEVVDLVTLNSKPLKRETRFYLREEVPLMKKLAEDGVFTSKFPFNASFKDNFQENCDYLNILIVPKGIRVLYVGENGTYGDSIFPPVIRFRFVEEDGNVMTWKCVSQEINLPSGRKFKWAYGAIAVIIIFLITYIVYNLL